MTLLQGPKDPVLPILMYTVLHMITQVLFWAGNQGNHKNWVPSMVSHNLNGDETKNWKLADSKNVTFLNSPIFKFPFWKKLLHRLSHTSKLLASISLDLNCLNLVIYKWKMENWWIWKSDIFGIHQFSIFCWQILNQ